MMQVMMQVIMQVMQLPFCLFVLYLKIIKRVATSKRVLKTDAFEIAMTNLKGDGYEEARSSRQSIL